MEVNKRTLKAKEKYEGKVFKTNNFGDYIVTKCVSGKEVHIKFIDTGYEAVVSVSNIAVGNIKDNLKPFVYGVGYLGSNLELKSTYYGKDCPIYQRWRMMIRRCYSEKFHQRCPTYIGCYVSDDFKDYSKWREWYDNYQYKHDGWQLDKDLIIKGNKVYSATTCVFLPREINTVLLKRDKTRGEYLIGVCYNKRNENFEVAMSKYGKTVNLGYFDNEYDAHLAYKEVKEAHLKELADKYKRLARLKSIQSIV